MSTDMTKTDRDKSKKLGSNDDVRIDFADGEPSITETPKPGETKTKSAGKPD